MKSLVFPILWGLTPAIMAAPPANDAYLNRIIVGSVDSYSTTATNVEATVQSSENTLSSAMGATIWWQWTAPSSGWVRMDTLGSAVDTVLKVTTAAGVSAAAFGYNDDEIPGYGVSGFTFQATQGTVYYIAIGGYNDGVSVSEGTISFRISMAAADGPRVWPSALTFSPASVDVTSADANVTATFTVAGALGQVGEVDLFLRRATGNVIYPPVVSSTSFISGIANAGNVVTIPRYLSPGAWVPRVDLVLGDGTTLLFGNAASGRPYLLPTTTSLSVVNSGTADATAPAITAFSITPTSANVNNGPANVSVSATISDATSGVKELQAYLYSYLNPALDLPLSISLTSGSGNNGTWTGTTSIPREYPSGTYSVYVYLEDKALNAIDYGGFGTLDFPGAAPLIDVSLAGGGAYWRWAYEYIYPYSDEVDLSLDPNDDGLDNLSCYAFGLEPVFYGPLVDVPIMKMVGTAPQSLAFEFWRRVGPATGMTYEPQICDNLQAADWVSFPGTPTRIDGDATWDYLRIVDPENTTTKPKRFARMKLTYVDN